MSIPSIGPGAESVTVLLYAADPASGRWDDPETVWDGAVWSAQAFREVDCYVAEATGTWGASQEAGILSVAEAGEIDLTTYDPDRVLDPINADSPFYGAVVPGNSVRIATTEGTVVATAYIDAAEYDLAAGAGRIRAVDAIAYLSQAQVPDGTSLPDTLRARTRAVVAAVGLSEQVQVELDTPDSPPDPPVAPHDGKSAPAWQLIAAAALDALVYVWADPTGTLRFRGWDSLPDSGVNVGCAPPDADPADVWVVGVSTVGIAANADAIRNSVRAYSAVDVWTPAAADVASQRQYGPRPFDVDRIVPNFPQWSDAILQDRAGSGLELAVGEIRPYTTAELESILAAHLLGPANVRLRDDAHGALLDIDVGLIGARTDITPGGWRFQWTTMLPRVAWDSIEPPNPEPEPPDPNRPYHTETRRYNCNKDVTLGLKGGTKAGAGAASTCAFGVWSGWTLRSCLNFASIPWGPSSGVGQIRAYKGADLHVRTSSQVMVGFGSNPKTQIRRITETWSEGSAPNLDTGNAEVWPGPSTTTTDQVTRTHPHTESVWQTWAVDKLVQAWAPGNLGGKGASQMGLRLGEASNSNANTGEISAQGANGAYLMVTVDVFDA